MINCEVISKNLQSPERRDRQNALKDLLNFCQDNNTTDESIIAVYGETYLYILKCYSDKYEGCRELCCEVVSEFFKRLPRNDYYFQYVVTTLADRMGQKETLEESEEMRLLFVKQLNFLINKFRQHDESKDLMLTSYNEIINIIVKALQDNYPAVQKEACSCIKNLSEATPSFHYRAEALVKPLIVMLHHKHSQTRMAAVEALGIVSLHITSNNDCISDIINEISPLLMDSMPLVRRECGQVGCKMLMHLRDRYSFFPRIIPLVLCCLNDDTPDVRKDINNLWIKCGDLYYEENEEELRKKEIVDDMLPRYPDDVKRPTLGCRAIVQRSLKIVKLILREIGDWKDEVRLHSLKLFWQVILHLEVMLAVEILEVFPVLSKACADKEIEVMKEAVKCAELMGILMVYKEWFSYCLDVLKDTPRLGYLKCFYYLFLGSGSNSKSDIQAIAETLHKKEFSQNLNPEFQKYLLKFVELLVNRLKQERSVEQAMDNLSIENSDKTEEYLYHIIIKVMALSCDDVDSSLQKTGENLITKLDSSHSLHEKHLISVLNTFDCLDAEIDGNSEPILLLHGVIVLCGFRQAYLQKLKECILTVWKYATPDAKVKIFSAISIAMMIWNSSISPSLDVSIDSLKSFVHDIIVPHLTWRAGAGAESLRAMATATLCSITQGAPEESPKVLTDVVPYFASLIEDHNVTTRVYALRCLMNFAELKDEQYKEISYAVLQRLDDPSAEVREWAARSIIKLRLARDETTDDQLVEKVRKNIFSTLFLHFDGPELKLKNIIKNSLIILGKQHKPIFEEAYNKAFAMFNNAEFREIQSLVGAEI